MGRRPNEFCTKQQIEAIRMMVETDLTREQIIEKLGIGRSTFYNWLSKEYFRKKLIEYSDRILVDVRAESLKRIKALMRQEEDKRTALASAKFLCELNGLSSVTKVDVNTTETIQIKLVDEEKEEEE